MIIHMKLSSKTENKIRVDSFEHHHPKSNWPLSIQGRFLFVATER